LVIRKPDIAARFVEKKEAIVLGINVYEFLGQVYKGALNPEPDLSVNIREFLAEVYQAVEAPSKPAAIQIEPIDI